MSFVLYLITDPRPDVVAITEAALRGGPPGSLAVQARIKGASARELAALGAALLPICRAAEAPLLINDRADVAKAIGADGAHLPEDGLTVGEARRVLGDAAWIGRSCHDRAGLLEAERAGADLATLGPIEHVPGKDAPIGVAGFASMAREVRVPVYALGGVGPANARALRDAGARGLAVIRAVYDAPDPAAAVRAIIDALP